MVAAFEDHNVTDPVIIRLFSRLVFFYLMLYMPDPDAQRLGLGVNR